MCIVPHDILYLWRNGCRMAHLMTRVSSLRFGYSGCARTLRFNMSHTYLLGFRSILCAGHCSVRRLCVTSITCVLLSAWYGALSFANIISRLKRIWGKRTDRMASFGCRIAFMFPGMRTTIILCTWERLCAFCSVNSCHMKCFPCKTIREEYFPTKIDNYLAVHEKPKHIAIFAPTIPHVRLCA